MNTLRRRHVQLAVLSSLFPLVTGTMLKIHRSFSHSDLSAYPDHEMTAAIETALTLVLSFAVGVFLAINSMIEENKFGGVGMLALVVNLITPFIVLWWW